MELEFSNNYVLAVIVLLWMLCFCRNVLECFTFVLKGLDGCVEHDVCCVRPCVEFWRSVGMGEALRQSVVLFCFLQPAVFCVIFVFKQSSAEDLASSIVLYSLALNSSSVAYKHGNDSHPLQSATVADLDVVEIDYIVLVMPFALLVSVTSLLWVHSIKVGDMAADTTWDAQMPESVYVYEVAYYLEVWSMNLSFLAVMSSERSLLEVHFASLALTLMVVYVLAQSRHPASHGLGEHAASMLVGCCFFSILVPLWLDMLQMACPVALVVCGVHFFVLAALITFHSFARGESTAGQILMVRLTCTFAASVTHMAVYASGRNRVCMA